MPLSLSLQCPSTHTVDSREHWANYPQGNNSFESWLAFLILEPWNTCAISCGLPPCASPKTEFFCRKPTFSAGKCIFLQGTLPGRCIILLLFALAGSESDNPTMSETCEAPLASKSEYLWESLVFFWGDQTFVGLPCKQRKSAFQKSEIAEECRRLGDFFSGCIV